MFDVVVVVVVNTHHRPAGARVMITLTFVMCQFGWQV